MPSSSTLTIDLESIRSNINTFTQKGEVMAMVKADAYGTGALALIPHLKAFGVCILGVSHVNEAIHLRESGVEMPIFVISAPPFEAESVAKYRLQPAVSSFQEAKALNASAFETIPVHLQINTGMNRFGVEPEEALALAEWIHNSPHLRLEGVMTHFSSADIPDFDPFTAEQIKRFKSIVDRLNPRPRWIHAANGPAAIRFSIPFCNLLRVGVSLFGYGFESNLKPALTFETHIAYIADRKKGETVGYKRGYLIEREKMRIGILPVGYFDGLHRHYKEKGYVRIHGKNAPMIGNICMDFMMVDLTEIPEAHVGDKATLFDQYLSPETVACWGNTDVREFLVSIGSRTERIYDEQGLPRAICPIEEDSSARQHLLPA